MVGWSAVKIIANLQLMALRHPGHECRGGLLLVITPGRPFPNSCDILFETTKIAPFVV
jgi:hypothetical protein